MVSSNNSDCRFRFIPKASGCGLLIRNETGQDIEQGTLIIGGGTCIVTSACIEDCNSAQADFICGDSPFWDVVFCEPFLDDIEFGDIVETPDGVELGIAIPGGKHPLLIKELAGTYAKEIVSAAPVAQAGERCVRIACGKSTSGQSGQGTGMDCCDDVADILTKICKVEQMLMKPLAECIVMKDSYEIPRCLCLTVPDSIAI